MKFGRNELASSMVGIGFWGFLGGGAFGLLFNALMSGYPLHYIVFPEAVNWQNLASMSMMLLFIPVAYALVRVSGRLKPLIIVGGLFSAIFNIIPKMMLIPGPWTTIMSILASGGVFMALVGWMFSTVWGQPDGHATSLASGWAGVFAGSVMGYLFDMNTVIGGFPSAVLAMIFAGVLGFVIMIAGFIIPEFGPAAQKKQAQA